MCDVTPPPLRMDFELPAGPRLPVLRRFFGNFQVAEAGESPMPAAGAHMHAHTSALIDTRRSTLYSGVEEAGFMVFLCGGRAECECDSCGRGLLDLMRNARDCR